jgi:hypothetical protein
MIFKSCPSPRRCHKKAPRTIFSMINDHELNALNDHEHLLCKFSLLSKECDELKSKLESIEIKTNDFFELDESSTYPLFNSYLQGRCFNFLHWFNKSCSPPCNENVVVEIRTKCKNHRTCLGVVLSHVEAVVKH